MKAIYLTKTNVSEVASRYGIAEQDYEQFLPLGYYVVVDFGNEDWYDLISVANFTKLFNKTGDIDNGWISIERK